MFSEIAIAFALRAAEATARTIPPACATIDATAFPCPDGTVVQTFTDPMPSIEMDTDGVVRTYYPPAETEDDPGWDCRTQGNHVCGVGYDPDHPGNPTVYGVPVDTLRQAQALSCIIGSALGTGSDSCLYFDGPTMNVLIDTGAAMRGQADRV